VNTCLSFALPSLSLPWVIHIGNYSHHYKREGKNASGLPVTVQVSFEWARGVILRPGILVSSGIPALDRAALAAVHNAAIPPPPGNMGIGPFQFAVWVQSSLSEGS